MTRQLLGIAGRPGQSVANVFEYRASQLERPIETDSASIGMGQPVPIQAVSRNPDGTMKAVQQRTLTIATPGGERVLVFPKAWGPKQLRDAAAARHLLGGKVVRAHAAPPETAEEFVSASRDVIWEVFGKSTFDVYQTRLDRPPAETEYRRLRFNLSRDYLRAVAKVGFHYFLWACPSVGGDETDFAAIREFVSADRGVVDDVLQRHDSRIDRTSPEEGGTDHDCHVLVAYANDADLLATIHFFSQSAGPQFPTFAVRLGHRPRVIRPGWLKGHIAEYCPDIPGHAGRLRELSHESV
jgi:hypothetical protein